MTDVGLQAQIEAIYREEYGRVVASLARRFGDLDIAEDAASEALVRPWLPPADRPADAGTVAEAIAAHRAGLDERLRKAEVERAAAEARAVEQRKRRRVQLGLALAVGLLVVSVGVGLWKVDEQRRERRLPVTQDFATRA